MAADKTSPDIAKDNITTDSRFNARRYLETTLKREPHDLMTVVHIPGSDAFRVNWFGIRKESSTIAGMSIRYLRESQFLRCRMDEDGNPHISYPARQ